MLCIPKNIAKLSLSSVSCLSITCIVLSSANYERLFSRQNEKKSAARKEENISKVFNFQIEVLPNNVNKYR